MDTMKNVFICNSSYQILISAIMCELHYSKDQNTLLLDEYLYNSASKTLNLSSNAFFKRTICLSSDSFIHDISILFENCNFDRIHFFNWGNACSRYIFNNYNNSEFIALDEGLGSYRLFDIWSSQGIDLLKLKTVYLLDPSLSTDFELRHNIKEIELNTLVSNKLRWKAFLEKANGLFGYKPNKMPSIIYFDRYFVSENTLPYVYEQFYLKQLLKVLSPCDFGIKIHPLESIELAKLRYGKYSRNILKDSVVPWELVLMNITQKTLVLLSINSTPIILSKYWGNLLDISITSISLIDVVKDYIDQQELYILPLIEHYNAIHPETAVFRARSFYEVESQISLALSPDKRDILTNQENSIEREELTWLKFQIKKYSKLFGNLVAIVRMSLYNNSQQITFIKRAVTYINGNIELSIELDREVTDCTKIEINYDIPNLSLNVRRCKVNAYSFTYDVNEATVTNQICLKSKSHFLSFTRLDVYIEFERPLIGYDYTQL